MNGVDYQHYRSKMFGVYESVLKESKSREYAYDTAKDFVAREVKPRSKTWFNGLIAELIFYHKYKDSLHLKITPPNIDIAYGADFTGVDPVTGKKIMIDVTANLKSKYRKSVSDWEEDVKNAKILGYEYKLAPILPDGDKSDKNTDENIIPYMIPLNERGNPGLFIIHLERENDNPYRAGFWNLLATPYIVYFESLTSSLPVDYQFVTQQFVIFNASPVDDLEGEIIDSNPDISEKQLQNLILSDRFHIAQLARDLIKVVPAGIVEKYYIITNPADADGYFSNLVTWIQPVKFHYNFLKRPFKHILDIPFT